MFRVNEVLPGVRHITDAMGVSFTLIEGRESAVLFDTGYGLEDVRAFVATLTDKPVKVLLSHGHHDHILGARWFDIVYLCRDDTDEFRQRTGREQRTRVAGQAAEQGVPVPEDFLTAEFRDPEEIRFTDQAGPFEYTTEHLGGPDVEVIHVPGHTPGSIVLCVPSLSLLLTGDDWNPCTWMWFPSSDAADSWRDSMEKLLKTVRTDFGTDVKKVICSHQQAAREGAELKAFLAYMTDERLVQAPAVDMGSPIDTHRVVKDEWTLIFDRAKLR